MTRTEPTPSNAQGLHSHWRSGALGASPKVARTTLGSWGYKRKEIVPLSTKHEERCAIEHQKVWKLEMETCAIEHQVEMRNEGVPLSTELT